MKTKLITALRATASALEKGTFYYKWSSPSRCNCGALFCTLTGLSSVELDKRIPKPADEKPRDSASWTNVAGQYCPITGMPTHELFMELFGYGLTIDDFQDLEYLQNEKVLARMNLGTETIKTGWFRSETRPAKADYGNQEHVAKYMRAWADLLAEEGRMDDVAVSDRAQMPTAAFTVMELLITVVLVGLVAVAIWGPRRAKSKVQSPKANVAAANIYTADDVGGWTVVGDENVAVQGSNNVVARGISNTASFDAGRANYASTAQSFSSLDEFIAAQTNEVFKAVLQMVNDGHQQGKDDAMVEIIMRGSLDVLRDRIGTTNGMAFPQDHEQFNEEMARHQL